MKLVELNTIVIGEERQRRDFGPDAMAELAESIRRLGLMHPVVCREMADGSLKLVAGERRLRTVKDLTFLGEPLKHNGQIVPKGFIPISLLHDLSELEAEEAELEENTCRKDLSWQEQSAALERLHRLREKQAEARQEKHTITDLAREVKGNAEGSNREAVRQQVIVAKHLDNPAIAKAKSVDEAYKLLKKQEDKLKREKLALEVGRTFNSQMHNLVNEDCLEWMRNSPPGVFDVILTDPPYGMGADEFGDAGGRLLVQDHTYRDDLDSWKKLIPEWAMECFRVAKPQAHLYAFCDIDNLHLMKQYLKDAGWDVFRTPLTYHKVGSGRVPRPEHGPRRCTEWIIYAIKGGKRVTGIYPDIVPCRGDDNLGFGAQKAVEGFENLLMRSVQPGDHVLDTFAGTGPIIPAGHRLKCKVTAIELSQERFGVMLERLRKLHEED